MADWPFVVAPLGPLFNLSPWHIGSIAGVTGSLGAPASAVWPVANTAFFYPIRVNGPVLARKVYWINGTAVSGNVDAGLYDAKGRRLLSSGSTLQAVVSALQEVDIVDVRFGPGLFYLALAMDNVTGTIFRSDLAVAVELRCLGVFEQAAAFPLPATFTAAAMATAYIPTFGVSTRVLV